MKKSKFEELVARGDVAACMFELDGGVTWDPEEPEVLWQGGEYRLLADGTWEAAAAAHLGVLSGWQSATFRDYMAPVFDELARRLLEERKQQQALDEHNDKMETQLSVDDPGYARRSAEIAQGSARLFGSALGLDEETLTERATRRNFRDHQDRLGDLDRRLMRVEEDLLLVRGQAAHVDEREAADYLSTQERLAALERKVDQLGEGVVDNVNCLDRRIDLLESQPTPGVAGDLPAGAGATQREASSRWVQVDREVFDRLLALWRLWGPEGELRSLLRSHDRPGYGWYSQLRSELLALPDEVKP